MPRLMMNGPIKDPKRLEKMTMGTAKFVKTLGVMNEPSAVVIIVGS